MVMKKHPERLLRTLQDLISKAECSTSLSTFPFHSWPVLSRCWRKLSSISKASRCGASVAAVRSTARGLIDTSNWLYIRGASEAEVKGFHRITLNVKGRNEMSKSITNKAISSLALIIAGAAGSASASEAPSVATHNLESSTAINADLDSLRMAEFASPESLLAAADGHHSDSIGSHHHHTIASTDGVKVADTASRFDV
ncbi:hypothetical protein XALC_1226 [Xanthomonas albilineans GPE PC73]|uniref:Uncharacterized protein n=2 Tax=Xanthomonas albilineans TaxID=29447 RepID=D2UA07_XANAP|nr:hypothetical protein XALC_1226 [Xanthomonas albilineans GPE PC73]